MSYSAAAHCCLSVASEAQGKTKYPIFYCQCGNSKFIAVAKEHNELNFNRSVTKAVFNSPPIANSSLVVKEMEDFVIIWKINF